MNHLDEVPILDRPAKMILIRAISITFTALLVLSANAHAQSQPNIIQIIADDLGWVDLSGGQTNLGNGSNYYQTPSLEALAQGGIAFSSAYAQPTCSPTRAALFTGQYAPRNGLHTVGSLNGSGDDTLLLGPENGSSIQAQKLTIAELLQANGYTTGHIGKFHCTSSSDAIQNDHGFDFNIGGTNSGGPSGSVPYFAEQNGNGRWVFGNSHGPELDAYASPYTQAYIDDNLIPFANGNDPSILVGTPKHLNDAMADAVVDFVQARINDGEPFFLNVAFNAVHVEVNSRPDLETKYESLPTSSTPEHNDPGYAGLLEGMDQAIGRIVDFVEQSGLSDDTLILFVSDNGGTTAHTDNFPLEGSKGNFTEGGIRVPMIAYMPGTIPAGTITNVATHVVDLYPTYAELCQATLPSSDEQVIEGESLLPIMMQQTSELIRDTIYYHFPGYSGQKVPMSMVIHDGDDGNRYKLTYYYEDRRFTFYDLTNDIGESTELISEGLSNQQREIANFATERLIQWLEDSGAVYPTTRATGEPVPPPHHSPDVQFVLSNSGFGVDLHSQTEGTIGLNGIEITLEAEGNNAVFDSFNFGIGVNSQDDSGSQNSQRRIDGSLPTPEEIVLSVNQDAILKELTLLSLEGDLIETAIVEFVSGDSPFADLYGFETSEMTTTPNSLSFVRQDDSNSNIDVRFGVLAQNEILLTAGTKIRITANPSTEGGIILQSISLATPQLVQLGIESFEVTNGTYVSGGLAELADSDNLDLTARRNVSDLQSRIGLELQTSTPIQHPTGIELQVESSVFARSSVSQVTELFDFQNQTWEVVDTRDAGRFADQTTTIAIYGGIANFVDSASPTILARIRYLSDNPRQQFSANIDRILFKVE